MLGHAHGLYVSDNPPYLSVCSTPLRPEIRLLLRVAALFGLILRKAAQLFIKLSLFSSAAVTNRYIDRREHTKSRDYVDV
jgi:hypothetical protein